MRSLKLKNNNYIDTSGIMHNKKKLSDILNDDYVIVREKQQNITQGNIASGAALNIRVDIDDIEGYKPICHLGVISSNNAGVMANPRLIASGSTYITPWLINCTNGTASVSSVVATFVYIKV